MNDDYEKIRKVIADKMVKIREYHFSHNLPIVYVKDGWIVKEYKDGRIVKVMKVNKPV